jgi:hypothetical protein
MNIIELAKEAGLLADDGEVWLSPYQEAMERFATLVRAEVEAEWIETNKALAKEIIERQWVDLTDDEIDLIEQRVYCRTTQKGRPLGVYAVELVRAVIAAFKEKNK